MAIQSASNLIPANNGTFYLLEDVYLKGGFMVKATLAERDALAVNNLKVGQLVLCLDENKIWQLTTLSFPDRNNPNAPEIVEWTEFLTGGDSIKDDAPQDDKTYGRKNGEWVEVQEGGGGSTGSFTRSVVIYTVDDLTAGATQTFNLTLGASCIVFNLTVNRPVQVNAYGTAARDEVNPYTFLATTDHLFDDGSTLLFDGTVIRSRNYSILANMETTRSDQIYFTLTSVDEGSGPVVMTLTYLPMELLDTTVPASGNLPPPAPNPDPGPSDSTAGT